VENDVKSDLIDLIAFITWVVLSVIFAWRFKKPRHVFFVSAGLATVGIALTTYRQGPLDGGGIIHIICAGLIGVAFFYAFKAIRSPKNRE
jgi:CHASE2 domain-containing sensor protein